MRLTRLAALGLTVFAPPLVAQEPNFGRAIAVGSAELLIGQPVNWYGPGTVYSFRLEADGIWREADRLIASDSARMDDFGRAIATLENIAAVAAPRKHDGAGVVYLFGREAAGANWQERSILTAPDGGQFGSALALDERQLLIAAPGAAGGGVVYSYNRSNTSAPAQVIEAPATAGPGGFGMAMALDGETLLIAAPAADSAVGAVYAYQRAADGTWNGGTPLPLPRITGQGGGRSGSSLLVDGDRAYVGAPGAAVVYVLDRSPGGSWQLSAELRAFDSPRGSRFGTALTLVDSELWVGAPGVKGSNGTVYRFLASNSGDFSGAMRFDADSAAGNNWPFAFGSTLAASGNHAIVAMPFRDFGEGRVLVASRDGDIWIQHQLLTGEIHVLGGGAAEATRCEDGRIGVFTCNNVEVIAHMPTAALGGARGAWVNDVWGWTDPESSRDYALVARRDGISFVDVTAPAAPRLVGDLPRTEGSAPSVWRDIKVIDNHAYIVADGAGAHGMQVFDLTRLRVVGGEPQMFTPDTTYHEIFSAHNVVADTASKHLYVVGANSGGQTCGGGLHMIDAREPENLRFLGCYNDTGGNNPRGYTHDAQCLIYRGPDAEYQGREICVGSNESEINIADVTDKSKPVLIGRNSYPNVSYAHQGWFDAEQRYFYMNDEGDELDGVVEGTRTIVWDLTELDDPVVANMYIGPVMSSDHNLYVVGNRVYESNYGSGLRVLDITDRENPREVAYFDSAPLNDDGPGHSATQSGAWSNYPFFESGLVVFTSVREGLFIVRVNADPVP